MKNLWEIIYFPFYFILVHVFFCILSYLCIENVFRAKLKHAEWDFTFIYLFIFYLFN
jgi:hypothetical protein